MSWIASESNWEQRCYSHLEESDQDDDDDDDSTTDIEEMSADDCAAEFHDFLVSLKMRGQITAKTACILAWWAKQGGLNNAGTRLAVKPSRTGGAFSEHFDRVVGLNSCDDVYTISVPGHERATLGRATIPTTVNLLHHALAEEISQTPSFWETLDDMVVRKLLPPAYYDHELVKAHPHERFVPLLVYADGVKFQTRDNVVGFWLTNVVTQKRHFVCALRRRLLCRCGCAAWCSYHSVLLYMKWEITTMISGEYPRRTHDGRDWPTDHPHSAFCGQLLGFRAIILACKGDRAEIAHTFGFRSWGHYAHPCYSCNATGGPEGTWHAIDNVSMASLPWQPKTLATYEEACRRAEQRIIIRSRAELQMLLGCLKYDFRTKGFRGRHVCRDIFTLRHGDRLEPSATLIDIGALDEMVVPIGGLQLVFWRTSEQGMCTHRNPLFWPETFSVAARNRGRRTALLELGCISWLHS